MKWSIGWSHAALPAWPVSGGSVAYAAAGPMRRCCTSISGAGSARCPQRRSSPLRPLDRSATPEQMRSVMGKISHQIYSIV